MQEPTSRLGGRYRRASCCVKCGKRLRSVFATRCRECSDLEEDGREQYQQRHAGVMAFVEAIEDGVQL